MYKMQITLFGFNLNLEMLILIGVIYLILVVHTIGGCSNMPLLVEKLTNMTSDSSSSDSSDKLKKAALLKKKEGFAGANTNYGESSRYTLGDYSSMDTSSWGQPDMTVTKGKPLSKGVKDFMNRSEQPVPLPEGELLMFANTEFKPECCPNTFSTSSGCACMTGDQYNYLIGRGGNNVPYSEY
jgi:hypothetical protein